MNITLRENMNINAGEKVEAYYNLHKGGFSIKSLDKQNPNKGKVIGYAETVVIENATFKISESAHKSILDKKQKAVYAVVRGILKTASLEVETNTNDFKEGYVNPYTTKYFVNKNDQTQKLETAEKVILTNKSIFYK
jgi:bifunctional DNA-binding transcriptional regulator/antitoxin component of YhaV-PrlF toxin-antitoxin module